MQTEAFFFSVALTFSFTTAAFSTASRAAASRVTYNYPNKVAFRVTYRASIAHRQ